MSVRDTIILNPTDLRYLLIDSLRQYSDNVSFIGGNNPYRFSINKKTYYVMIKNVHESGDGRGNQDECRIQVAKSNNFNQALSSGYDVIVLGYFADEKVFTAWNPFIMRQRFNLRQTISLYSRFSTQRDAKQQKISSYRDNNGQSVISFKPEYLGLYLENLDSIHLVSEVELKELVGKSDALNNKDEDGELKTDQNLFTITHARTKRDPNFRHKVNEAYGHRCAMCGFQLELIEAAHIIPHSNEKGTDDVDNGISLCVLHHRAYDRALVYFDENFNIIINEEKMSYLEKVGLDSGARKFENLSFDQIQVPLSNTLKPNIQNIKIANQIRGIA
jgi:putative restriction endonuclease